MKSVSLLFPGQGSQYVGMGNSIREFSECKKVFEDADTALGFSISSLCAEGPEEKLKLTEFTQPAIVTHSIALFQKLKTILEAKEIKIDRVLGHSVGEYPALVAAGVLKFEDAVKAVNLRGKYMQEAVAPGEKNFDFNLQQYSITPEREETISFSDPYYSSNQAIVALAGSPAEGATTVADLADVKFGAQAGTTSLEFITSVIQPTPVWWG